MDEAGLLDNQHFEVSISPFTAMSGGLINIWGVPCQEGSSLLFQSYIKEKAIIVKYTWEDIYKMRSLTDKKLAEVYKTDFLNRAKGNEKSAYIRWNYYCDFEDSNGKFITRKLLTDNNILEESINVPISTDKNWVISSADLAPKFDYFSITIGLTSFNEYGEQLNKVCYMKTLNKNRDHKSMKEKCNELVDLCIKFKVDILTVDSTSQQLYFVQELNNVLKEKKCTTNLFPYPYSGNNKEKLFTYLESMLYDQKLKLLKEDESWESEKLVEEMLYFKKEKKENKISYSAPDSKNGNFSDDHINSLALFNMAYQYAYECSNNKRDFDDGSNLWRPRLQKYITEKPEQKIYNMPRTYMTVF
jgi:hypothetical protein